MALQFFRSASALSNSLRKTTLAIVDAGRELRTAHKERQLNAKDAIFKLPGMTLAQCVDFSRRFANLPVEIKIMIIKEAVLDPDDELSFVANFMLGRRFSRPFKRDKDYRADAMAQFLQVNAFRMPLRILRDGRVGDQLHQLSIQYTIQVVGGDATEAYGLPTTDAAKIQSISTLFPRLHSIVIRVKNRGKIYPGAKFTFHGVKYRADKWPEAVVWERINQVQCLMHLVQSLEFPQWRCNLTVDKRVVLSQIKERPSIPMIGAWDELKGRFTTIIASHALVKSNGCLTAQRQMFISGRMRRCGSAAAGFRKRKKFNRSALTSPGHLHNREIRQDFAPFNCLI